MDWVRSPPSNSHQGVEALAHNVMVLELRPPLGSNQGSMRSWGWGLVWCGISALIKRNTRALHHPPSVRKLRRHTKRWQPPTSQEERPQNDICLSGTLILNFPAFGTVRNKFLFLKPPSLCRLENVPFLQVPKWYWRCGSGNLGPHCL